MFEIFSHYALYWLVAVALALLLGPVAFYLTGAWAYRRKEILGGLSAASQQLYFKQFYPGDVGANFKSFYDTRFGRRRYAIPIVVLALTGWLAATWTIASMLVWTGLRPATGGTLNAISAAALSGGYLWVVDDLITRWRTRDLAPADLWWSAWRLMLAVPMAYAVTAILKPDAGVPVAFLFGAFPTRTVSTIARRLARRQLNLGADDEKAESELEKLQGIDTRIAERFADEGITTIVQLAYADPVELTMRCASFAFSFVIDCASQALAWEYLGDDLAKIRVCSLRGAQEIASAIDDLDGDDDDEKALAKKTIHVAAGIVAVDAAAFERTLREIAEDPYTEFLREVWVAS